ncbi:hypothetical protein HYQ46_007313 [Verticillium longisporum]|nr:hypothetical protein HYQ46_007313 [Verticillium longisporum]
MGTSQLYRISSPPSLLVDIFLFFDNFFWQDPPPSACLSFFGSAPVETFDRSLPSRRGCNCLSIPGIPSGLLAYH